MSIRLFRQTTVVYPHRQLFLCDEKILREMMLKLNDVVIAMSNLVELFGCAFAFFRREEEEMTY